MIKSAWNVGTERRFPLDILPPIDFPKSDNKIKYFPTEFCRIYTSDLNVVEESNDIKQDLDESIKASDKIESNQSKGFHL